MQTTNFQQINYVAQFDAVEHRDAVANLRRSTSESRVPVLESEPRPCSHNVIGSRRQHHLQRRTVTLYLAHTRRRSPGRDRGAIDRHSKVPGLQGYVVPGSHQAPFPRPR